MPTASSEDISKEIRESAARKALERAVGGAVHDLSSDKECGGVFESLQKQTVVATGH
jgi:hypothetical protein